MSEAPHSARLRYRPASADDAAFLHRHWNEPTVRRHLWDDRPVAEETVRQVLAATGDDFARPGYGLWLLIDAAGDVIGTCGLRPVEDTGDVELLYSILPQRSGHGFATEAALAVLRHAFVGLELARVRGSTDAGNAASLRVLEKVGMRPLATTMDAGGGLRHLVAVREDFLATWA